MQERWVTVQVHEFVEFHKMGASVVREVENIMASEVEVFIPFILHNVAGQDRPTQLFDGYIFIKHDDTHDFETRVRRARGTYLGGPLLRGGKISYISGSEIEKYREMLQKDLYSYIPSIGDTVEGLEGRFKGMLGVVEAVNEIDKVADVRFITRTRAVTATGLTFLALRPRDEFSGQ